jgi:hypothetical protein
MIFLVPLSGRFIALLLILAGILVGIEAFGLFGEYIHELFY